MTLALLLTVSVGLQPLAAEISGGRQIGAEALDGLPPADVVILGEVHDNPLHHQNQVRALRSLSPQALVFEMLTPEQAARVTPALRQDCEALGGTLGWADAGWPDFSMYCPLFQAVPDAAVFGAAIPRDEVRQVMAEGAAAVFGDGADRFGLEQPLAPAEQALREEELAAAHCYALPSGMLPGMVGAQRLRDAALAREAETAHRATGGPVAVIAGTGHARRDSGIPAKLRRAAPRLSVLSLGQLEQAPGPDAPYDFWIVTPAPARGDPCAAFR